jgi:hypothetical protein
MDLNRMIISEMFARAASRLPTSSGTRGASSDEDREARDANESARNGGESAASVPGPSLLVSLFAAPSTERRIPALSAA